MAKKTDRERFQTRFEEIDPETRQRLESLYRKHYQPPNGALGFKLDDLLWMTYSLGCEGVQRQMAGATALPFSFLQALRDALEIKEYGGSTAEE